jgi:AcrR family transcriptional regulator
MARPKQVSDVDLVKMARKVFLRDGPAAPVANIAKELGITPAALFHRVKTKDTLLVLALWPADPEELELLRAGLDPKRTFHDQLVVILSGLSRYLSVAVPAIFLLYAGGLPIGDKTDLRREPAMIRVRTELARWLNEAKKKYGLGFHNAKVLADALVGTLEARYMHGYLRQQKYSARQDHRFVAELIGEILQPVAKPRSTHRGKN